MILEICVNSFQSAKNAQEAQAHRIELCENLEVGGITPRLGLIERVLKELSIKAFVLIRPRAGDFVYSEAEFQQMKDDIQHCKKLGCHGIVSGILNEDNSLDLIRTKELVELSRPLDFTFHRAFDEVKNPIKTLHQLIELGADRILTSGQEEKAMEGIEFLKELNHIAKDKIRIMPGSGIRPENAKQFKNAGFKEIHASASKQLAGETVSDIETIKAILNAI